MTVKGNSKSRMQTITITKIALLVACLAASAYISIPLGFTPSPLTLQTLIINMIAILLTPLESFLAVLVYILVGLAGLPIFSGGIGGPAKLLGPSGGYIYAFLLAAPAMSWMKKYFLRITDKFIKNSSTSQIIAYSVNAIIIGMTIIYLLGTIHMKLIMGNTISEVLFMAVVPFIPLDLVKCVCAAAISVPIQKALKFAR